MGTHVKQRGLALVLATASLVLVAMAGSADAKIRVKTAAGHTLFNGQSAVVATATCKGDGWKTVGGGGIVTDDPTPDASRIHLTFSFPPGDSRKSWLSQAVHYTQSGTLTTKARCFKGATVKVRKKSTPIAATDGRDFFSYQAAAQTAHCPDKYKVLGGGGIITGDPVPDAGSVQLSFSIPDGRGWAVQGVNYSTNPVTLTTFATCAKGVRMKTVHDSAPVPSGSANVATAKCGDGWRVTGGGGILTGDPTPDAGYIALPFTMPGEGGRSWLSQGYASVFSGDTTLTTKARCVKV